MTKNKNQTAFSLIEISMVILVIGILIAGISNGVDLYDDYRLKVAQNLTKNSRVNRIPDLELWFETTGENSLATGTASFTDKPNPVDLDSIGRWNNINPNILPNARNHATQVTSTDNQPKYIRKGMNGLPALKFDGSNDYFFFNGDFLVGSDYTIFVVEARGSGKSNNFFLGGSSADSLSNLILGYGSDSSLNHANFGNGVTQSIPSYKNPINKIYGFYFSKTLGMSIYTNGILNINNSTQKSALTKYPNSSIGYYGHPSFYQGLISEMIFYSRALTNQERQGVEAYLSKKWGIKLE
jgi:prepilin-type N-terminal cleavage/methylation domain-containing protein